MYDIIYEMNDNNIYAGTGHRPDELGGYSEAATQKLIAFAVDILPLWQPTKLILGMAQGWDQALAHGACILNIPWVAAVAFKGQERLWPEPAQNIFHELLSKATEVITVCEGGYAPWKLQKRNEWMVDRAVSGMIALWNGNKEGGTYNCIKYAKERQCLVHNLWAGWKSLNDD